MIEPINPPVDLQEVDPDGPEPRPRRATRDADGNPHTVATSAPDQQRELRVEGRAKGPAGSEAAGGTN